jgi:Glycosyl transferases group 1
MTIKKSKSLRFLITPNVPHPYDQRMVKGLAEGFNRIGHYAGAMPSPLSAEELAKMCKSLSIDVVLQINRTRSLSVPLPPNVRHISWYQDVYPETLDGFAETFQSSDILYSLGDPEVLGLRAQMPCYAGSLFTGVDQATLNFKRQDIPKDVDLSLCGGLPAPVHMAPNHITDILWYLDNLVRRVPLFGRSKLFWVLRKLIFSKRLPIDHVPYATLLALVDIVESFYRPLRGELDIHMLAEAMRHQSTLFDNVLKETPISQSDPGDGGIAKILKPHTARYLGRTDLRARLIRYFAKESTYFQRSTLTPVEKAISYFSQSYPRIIDRRVLVEMASRVSDSLELYGPGLSAHDFARPYFKGVIDTQEALLRIYCRSRINLSNNTHGLGLHSRVLECMAVGGFIFMHESPHDNKPGGMLTEFEPGVHYGSYTPDSFHEEATRWLADDSDRLRAGMRAESIIRERHGWHHRARQIIDDLNR